MKNIKRLLFIFICFFLLTIGVNANELKKIDVNITLDNNGTAHIREIWNMNVDEGTEVFKSMYNLGNSSISKFVVYDETNKKYSFISNWDIDASLENKRYKNGFNYTDEGIELCWGMNSHGNHIYTISYDVSNYIFNTSDAQVLYWKLVNESRDMVPGNFSVKVSGPTTYSDKLDVWGYGYKGYAYVKDGVIEMSNEENTKLNSNDYVVLLVKYPLNTFNTTNTNEDYNDFNDVATSAKEGSFAYDYDSGSIFDNIFGIFYTILPILFVLIPIIFFAKRGLNGYKNNYDFGTKGNKIKMNEINNFRDIPCNKDIFKAYLLSLLYSFNKKQTDFLGAVLLKWIMEEQIIINKENNNISLNLTKDLKTTNKSEEELYLMMRAASHDGILEQNEFKNWSSKNYDKLLNWFKNIEDRECDILVNSQEISKAISGNIFKSSKYVLNDNIYYDAVKLAGLKKFLIDFSNIKEREAIEVHLWKEYLIFAQIFGIADKVSKQFKKLYPEILQDNTNLDYANIILINHFSNNAVHAASAARSAAQSYNAGGGGFSSGGGGGGSFGGGSSGCR